MTSLTPQMQLDKRPPQGCSILAFKVIQARVSDPLVIVVRREGDAFGMTSTILSDRVVPVDTRTAWRSTRRGVDLSSITTVLWVSRLWYDIDDFSRPWHFGDGDRSCIYGSSGRPVADVGEGLPMARSQSCFPYSSCSFVLHAFAVCTI